MQSANGILSFSNNGSTKIYDDNDKELGDLSEFTFTVEDSKVNGESVNYDLSFIKTGGLFSTIEKIV